MSAVPPAVPDTTAAVAAAPSAPAPANAGVAEPEHNEQVHPPEAPRDQAPKAEKLPTSTLRGQLAHLWSAAKQHGHPEIWGVTLADPASHIPTQIVLHKYLNANDGDLDKATDQLIKTLEWRAKMKPLDLLKKKFNPAKFGKLGYVTTYAERENETDAAAKEVFTWNVYGAVKSIDETFGNLEEFIEWRVAVMELALSELNLAAANKALGDVPDGFDPYKIVQVHDYKNISFLRQSPYVKAASTETIKIFAQNYPELLKEKFFVNVPAFMGFVYAFMKLFVSPKTIKKFHPMSNGANLAREFGQSKVKGLQYMLPAEYGGKGGELSTQGKETLLASDVPATTG